MAVFQQTVPDWHGDSSHSELEGGLPGHEGAGASWLLGYGVLRWNHLTPSCGPQTMERSCHFHPQSPSHHQEAICWLQTGEVWSNVGRSGLDIAIVLSGKNRPCVGLHEQLYCNYFSFHDELNLKLPSMWIFLTLAPPSGGVKKTLADSTAHLCLFEGSTVKDKAVINWIKLKINDLWISQYRLEHMHSS